MTVIGMCKPNKAFPPQFAFGHSLYHNNKKKIRPSSLHPVSITPIISPINLPIHPSIQSPSTHSFTHIPIHPFLDVAIHLSTHSSIHISIQLFLQSSIMSIPLHMPPLSFLYLFPFQSSSIWGLLIHPQHFFSSSHLSISAPHQYRSCENHQFLRPNVCHLSVITQVNLSV